MDEHQHTGHDAGEGLWLHANDRVIHHRVTTAATYGLLMLLSISSSRSVDQAYIQK
jgi:hypothetical protein